jgi:hypothetical protein
MLPAQASYTDPLKLTYAANYPYRSGDIVRRPSTDNGSAARLQVGGITNDSYLLYDFVRFREKNVVIPFHIRAKPLAGGSIEIWAGDYVNEFHWLGELEISGQSGVWADFSCNLEFSQWFNMWNEDNTRYDLKLVFMGENGKELFEISEFYIGHEKPGPAGTRDSVVRTGSAEFIDKNSVAITGNVFMEFDESEIIEVGVMYSLYHQIFLFPEVVYTVQAAGISSPFTVVINDLEHVPGVPFYNYCAYVKTTTGTYTGGIRRFEMPEAKAEP